MQLSRFFWNMFLRSKILLIIIVIYSKIVDAQRAQRPRVRVCSPVSIPNTVLRFRHSNKIMRINCVPGFTLQGTNYVGCENGKWNAVMPVCAKEGCTKPQDPPQGVVLASPFVANLFCKDKHKLAGGRVTYCNGTHWDRPLGECRETTDKIQLSCDFETDDLCGWYHDETHNFDWKRIMAANVFQKLRTGPQHDHTTLTSDSGHFMLMESFDQLQGSVARLISPIYSKKLTNISGCFKFYYFMYGATVGSLNVYIKPLSVDIDQITQDTKYLYFSLSGNQRNVWKEASFTIDQMKEDFQIIVEGTAGSSHLSDIAIDDTQLMTYSECNTESTSTTMEPEYTEYAIYDIQSCEGRCNETNSTGYGTAKIGSTIFKLCDCHSLCEDLHTCCPNYGQICEFGKSETSKDYGDSITTERTTEEDSSVFSTMPSSISSTKSSIATNIGVSQNSTYPTRPITEYTATTLQLFTVKSNGAVSTPPPNTTMVTLHVGENEITTEELITIEITTPSTSKPYLTSENVPLNRKEKVLTWNVVHNTQKYNARPTLLICVVTVLVPITIVFVVFVIKYFRKSNVIRFVYPYRYSKNDHSDTTTLTYNESNDIMLES